MNKNVTFIIEHYGTPPRKIDPSNKNKIYNHNAEIWSTYLMDLSDYKFLNNEGYNYIFIKVKNFSKYNWCKSLKIKNSKTVTDVFSKPLTKMQRKPTETGSDRGAEIPNSISQNY